MPDAPVVHRPAGCPSGLPAGWSGVDPDTLRRWADDGPHRGVRDAGRSPALRPAVDRAARRRPVERAPDRWPASAPAPSAWRAPTGAATTPDTTTGGVPADDTVERERYRRDGRRLVEALVAHLDAGARDGAARDRAEADAAALVDDLARRLARGGTSLTEAVALFVAARRPFLDALTGLGRRRALDAARLAALYDDASGLLDRLLLRLIATFQEAHGAMNPAVVLPGADLDPGPRLRPRPVRPVARAARRVPAHLDARDGLLRRRRRLRGDRRGERLERGALPDVVPDRRRVDGRLARARDGVPARPDAVRLQLRAVPVPGRAVHLPACATSPSTPAPGRCRCSTSSPPASSPWPSRSRPTSPTTAGRCWPPRPSSEPRS